MIRRHTLVTASAFLLLANTTVTTLAYHGDASGARVSVVNSPRAMATVMSYFHALKPQGYSIHDYEALERLYAPNVTLTESLSTGRPRSHTGLRQMRAFDELNTLSWGVLSTTQLSPTVVLTTEQPFTPGPGHELEHAAPWLTSFTIKNGKITTLIWRQLYLAGGLRRHAAQSHSSLTT
jgi:hypothetical protein